jgi:hypothetical protein
VLKVTLQISRSFYTSLDADIWPLDADIDADIWHEDTRYYHHGKLE